MLQVVYKFGYYVCRVYWFCVRPKAFGVKGILHYKKEVLLIRNSYGPVGWTFPGGGIKPRESLKKAVVREVKEEVGIEIHEPVYIGHYFTTDEYKKDLVHCFLSAVTSKDFTIDNSEVVEARWFPLTALPNLTPSGALAVKVLAAYKKPRRTKT